MHRVHRQYSPSGLYCATMVTACPAFFRAAAACSCVALDRSTPFTYTHTHTLELMPCINIHKCINAQAHRWELSGDQSRGCVCVCSRCVLCEGLCVTPKLIACNHFHPDIINSDSYCLQSLRTELWLRKMKVIFSHYTFWNTTYSRATHTSVISGAKKTLSGIWIVSRQ